jgi:F-type H+-transporting ATPase subunit epsilon
MSDKLTVEIITPEQSILKSNADEVTIPSYEGQIGILKDHVPIITFLRPGIISVQDLKKKEYYVEEGTVEFSNNNLIILTSSAHDLNNLNKRSIEDLLNQLKNKLSNDTFSDKERYLLSYKISTLEEINQ